MSLIVESKSKAAGGGARPTRLFLFSTTHRSGHRSFSQPCRNLVTSLHSSRVLQQHSRGIEHQSVPAIKNGKGKKPLKWPQKWLEFPSLPQQQRRSRGRKCGHARIQFLVDAGK